jgi:hypothetical protein
MPAAVDDSDFWNSMAQGLLEDAKKSHLPGFVFSKVYIMWLASVRPGPEPPQEAEYVRPAEVFAGQDSQT